MITIDFAGKLPSGFKKDDIAKLATLTLRRVGVKGKRAMGVRVVTDAAMRKLNRIHRKKDKVTDILSFSAQEGVPKVLRDAEELGDLIIALAQVTRQAKDIGRAPKDEFALMIVHGTLHLLGYDHETVEQENEMFGLQQDVLMQAGIF